MSGADEMRRVRRKDLLFPRHQCDVRRALGSDDAVIDLARQKPQRQANHALAMRQHPLNGVMRLASVGGAQNGGDAEQGGADRLLRSRQAGRDDRHRGGVFAVPVDCR